MPRRTPASSSTIRQHTGRAADTVADGATTTDAAFAAYSEIAARVITAKLALADALDAVEVAAR